MNCDAEVFFLSEKCHFREEDGESAILFLAFTNAEGSAHILLELVEACLSTEPEYSLGSVLVVLSFDAEVLVSILGSLFRLYAWSEEMVRPLPTMVKPEEDPGLLLVLLLLLLLFTEEDEDDNDNAGEDGDDGRGICGGSEDIMITLVVCLLNNCLVAARRRISRYSVIRSIISRFNTPVDEK